MFNCKRCDSQIIFGNGRCLNAHTGRPHDIRNCKTKPGYVYCPKCQKCYLKTSACTHYLTYGWKFNHKEEFVLNLILENYVNGDWFQRKRNRKTSFDKMKTEEKTCDKCKKILPKKWTRIETDAHEKECNLQTQLI